MAVGLRKHWSGHRIEAKGPRYTSQTSPPTMYQAAFSAFHRRLSASRFPEG